MNPAFIIIPIIGAIGVLLTRKASAADIESPPQNNDVPNSFYDSDFYSGEPPVLVQPITKYKIPYEDNFRQAGARFGVDWMLIAAHASVESSYNPRAVNKSDNESLGLCQILCKPDGNNGCANPLNVEDWETMTRDDLFDPQINCDVAAQIIAENVQRYGMPRAIAVYNSYDQRTKPQSGPFKNQDYVNKVLQKYRELQAQG